MYTQTEKSKENKNRMAISSVVQKKSNRKQGVGLVDNRREMVEQRKLQNNIFNCVTQGEQTDSLLQRQPVVQFNLDQNGNKCKSHVKWIRKLIPEIQLRLNELRDMDDFRKTYLNLRHQTKITQVGIHIGRYLTETNQDHFSTDNHFNSGNARRLEFLENRLIGYKLDINALWMEFVNRDVNDFLRTQVRRMTTFTTRVLADSDLATRVLSFNNQPIDRDDVAQHVTDRIHSFKRPGLKGWMKAIDTEDSGSHIIIISAGNHGGFPIHFTNHKDNVNGVATIDEHNNAVINKLFPDSVGWMGAHTTLELFGKNDPKNPHFFKGEGLKMPSNASNGDQPTFNQQCRDKLTEAGITVANTELALSHALTNTINNKIAPQVTNLKAERNNQIL
ncbi:hypothetical protein VA7868_01477 [Vibrio aerogenes CECT 7868]|uniref:Uncharacterized protein n=1 Tax=Vibrio aerogenes CECT 7868 TaxID=1216006 RepID=A0A1M5Y3U7_9VIBR|nr:hypothetical protein [Vibrio aerogenes]SHI06717.1 hypothetical protein VA7868_01477 [Vibrio aerogenes CECT 7868]